MISAMLVKRQRFQNQRTMTCFLRKLKEKYLEVLDNIWLEAFHLAFGKMKQTHQYQMSNQHEKQPHNLKCRILNPSMILEKYE